MDLKQLEYFVSVVDLGGFSRAARVLGVAQPAISRQVRALELDLRHTLLHRNGRGATPTDAGARLLEHARSILQQVERARSDVGGDRDGSGGHVTIGLPPTFARVHTTPLVREFRHRHPQASVSIVEGLSVDILGWVVVGRIDVGVLYNPTPSPSVDVMPLFEEDLCLIGPKPAPGDPRTVRLRDLPRYPLIVPSRPNFIRALIEARLAALGLRPQVALEIDAVGAIIELAAEGQGYAVLSPRAVPPGELGARLVRRPIVQPALKAALALAVSSSRPATPIQRSAVALLHDLIGNGPKPA